MSYKLRSTIVGIVDRSLQTIKLDESNPIGGFFLIGFIKVIPEPWFNYWITNFPVRTKSVTC